MDDIMTFVKVNERVALGSVSNFSPSLDMMLLLFNPVCFRGTPSGENRDRLRQGLQIQESSLYVKK